jgi:succinyl-CoA synthetase beta subunit
VRQGGRESSAYKSIGEIKVPVVVRLQGTNALEAKEIIDNSGLSVISALSFGEAAVKVGASRLQRTFSADQGSHFPSS